MDKMGEGALSCGRTVGLMDGDRPEGSVYISNKNGNSYLDLLMRISRITGIMIISSKIMHIVRTSFKT